MFKKYSSASKHDLDMTNLSIHLHLVRSTTHDDVRSYLFLYILHRFGNHSVIGHGQIRGQIVFVASQACLGSCLNTV